MKKEKVLIPCLIAVMVLSGLLSACAAPTAAPVAVEKQFTPTVAASSDLPVSTGTVEAAPLTFTDDLGRVITLEALPTRIICTSPSITESLFAIGAGAQVVGRDEYSVLPEEALQVQSVGNFYNTIPEETILALQPDLLIAADIIPEEHVSVLENLGLAVYWQADPHDLDGLYTNLEKLATLTGHKEEAAALVQSLQARVAAVDEKIAVLSYAPLVFYELDASDLMNPYTAGKGTFIDHLIGRAGGINIGSALQEQYAQISSEVVIAQNPDIILLADAMYGVTPESIAGRAGWENINAVKKDRIVPFDPYLMSVPSPSLVTGLETAARILHPEVFK